jgi:hypothetical protein
MTRRQVGTLGLILFLLSVAGFVSASGPTPTATPPSPTPAASVAASASPMENAVPEAPVASSTDWITKTWFWLAVGVLVFGALVLMAEYLLTLLAIRQQGPGKDDEAGDAGRRYILITLVIVATVFLTVSHVDDQHIAPAVSLFGVIAGYLLGRGDRKQDQGGQK